MFGLSVWEIVIILLVALLVLGPQQLPKVAKQVGRGVREFRRTTMDLQDKIQEAVWESEDEERKNARKHAAPELKPAVGIEARGALTEGPPSDDAKSGA